jgi:hypothetical protein
MKSKLYGRFARNTRKFDGEAFTQYAFVERGMIAGDWVCSFLLVTSKP